MYEGLRSPTIHTPSSLGEYTQIVSRYPNIRLWAGGTYIMSRKNYYPNDWICDYISLDSIPELKKVSRTDTYIEIGAMATLEQILEIGKTSLPKFVSDTISSIGNLVLRNQITIGGALCTPDIRTSLTSTLIITNTTAELRTLSNGKLIAKWVPLAKLYDENGNLNLPKDSGSLVTRIRIYFESKSFERFYSVGDYIRKPDECVIFSISLNHQNNYISNTDFCFTYPDLGFYRGNSIKSELEGIKLPVHQNRINTLSYRLIEDLSSVKPGLTPLQLERSRRVFKNALQDLNIGLY